MPRSPLPQTRLGDCLVAADQRRGQGGYAGDPVSTGGHVASIGQIPSILAPASRPAAPQAAMASPYHRRKKAALSSLQ